MYNILFYNKFIICLYMFRAPCAHHQEDKGVVYWKQNFRILILVINQLNAQNLVL